VVAVESDLGLLVGEVIIVRILILPPRTTERRCLNFVELERRVCKRFVLHVIY